MKIPSTVEKISTVIISILLLLGSSMMSSFCHAKIGGEEQLQLDNNLEEYSNSNTVVTESNMEEKEDKISKSD